MNTENNNMVQLGVYVNGSANVPERFWEYALVTDINCESSYPYNVYCFSQKHTDKYNNFTKEEKTKARFAFVNNLKK
tara:strand:+ start:261 stop:491 length:231 start_codon:yes stop_codon:yes gene_type:complete